LALLAIVVTIPILLAVVGGWPLTTVSYQQAARTVHGPVDPHLITAWLSWGALIMAWISWMWMTVCVVLELRSWATGRSPVRLPASRAVQSVAAFLVGTTLALSAVGAKESVVKAPPNTRASAIVPPAVGLKVIDDWSLVGTTQHWDESTGRYAFASEVAQTGRSHDPLVLTGDAAFEEADGPDHGGRRSSPPPVANDGNDPNDGYGGSDHSVTTPDRFSLLTDADLSSARALSADSAPRYGQVTAAASPSQHRVEPRETLWSIAADHLGSSLRWRELAELNYGIRQADGGALTTAHWVTTGWLLQLPVTSDGFRPHDRQSNVHQPNGHQQLTNGRSLTASERATVGFENRPGRDPSTLLPTPATEVQSVYVGDDGGHLVGAPLVPIGGSVVGAGVVSILDRMRRVQQRRRSSGRLIKLPDQNRATIEQRLRIGDGSEIISIIDSSLRLLNQQWHDAIGEVPVVRGVRILDDVIELVVDGLDGSVRLPEHVVAGDDGTSLLVDRSLLSRRLSSARRLRATRSPAPLLVTVGQGADDTVMANLESLGSLVIQGDDAGCDAVVRALALELATSHWAGQFDLVVVGFGTELERFTRVRSTLDSPSLVRTLCHRRIGAHQALETTGYGSFGEGRCLTDSDRWDPIVVICSSSVDGADVIELLDAGSDPSAGMAVVAVGPRDKAKYGVSLSATQPSPSLELLGSVVFPHMIQAEEAAQVTALLDTAGSHESVLSSDEPYVHLSVPVLGWTFDPTSTSTSARVGRPSEVGAFAGEDADAVGGSALVEVKILGTIEISGAAREFTRAWAKELVVYLAMHPKGVTNEVWATALWPDRLMAPSSLHSTASVARRALGRSPDGIDHLPRSHGRLALSPTVVTDWDHFVELAESPAIEQWRSALDLVRGRPFEGLRSSDWPILEGIGPAIEAAVVDLSGRLAGSYLAAGDPSGAEWSARRGLLVSPYDERLYRMLLRAADLAGNPAGVEAVMAELVRLVADDVEPFDSVHPSTIDLYRSLTRRKSGMPLTQRHG
jgi:DNA-binding SARP family transcriptional activator